MNVKMATSERVPGFADTILEQGGDISSKLDMLRQEKFPPNAQKTLRQFSLAEVAEFVGVSQSYLKKLHLQGKGVEPATTTSTGRRYYTADQVNDLRKHLDRVQHRKEGERLQVIAVVNFKGGSGKTTTSAHLAQFLALRGYRVLAVDLDPQASLTALYGIQPELDDKASLYEALRYDDERSSIKHIIQKTNFPNLDVVPANLELQEYEYDTPLAMQHSIEGKRFFTRFGKALADVDDRYDVVVVDCPPQLGYLTLTALTAATSVLITVHPQMLDLMSMSQFLLMLGNITKTIKRAGANVEMDWLRYLITRYEPTDVPQAQMLGFMHSMLAEEILTQPMVKSTAIADAGLTKQTLYEVERNNFTRGTYDRAIECMDAVNFEIQGLVHRAWGRM
jgi:chromosome partitioning protein